MGIKRGDDELGRRVLRLEVGGEVGFLVALEHDLRVVEVGLLSGRVIILRTHV